MDHRKIRLLIMGMVVLALMVSCPDSGQVELGAVSSLSPADGTSTTDTTPTLSWDEVPDAAGYEVQLDDSKAELEASQIQSVTDTFYTPSSALTNGQTHYWRVRAVDGAGQKGTWSEIYSLAVSIGAVSGLGPADGATTTDTTPTLSWDEVPDAAGYEVQLADSKAGLETSPAQSAADTSYTPSSALTNEQTHYWRVRAVDGAGQKGIWSEIYSLAVSIGAVSGLGPADGATATDTTPTLSWDEVPDAAGYEIQLADSKAGLETSPAQSAADTSYTPSSALVNEKTHYWRVRAVDGAGQKGIWSEIYSLAVNFPCPERSGYILHTLIGAYKRADPLLASAGGGWSWAEGDLE